MKEILVFLNFSPGILNAMCFGGVGEKFWN